MAASPATSQYVLNEVARQLLNRVVLIKRADRSYDPQFKGMGAKARQGGQAGSIIQARLPQRIRVASGATMNKQPVQHLTTPVEITDQSNAGIELSSWVLGLELSEIQKNVINPCVNALVQDMEYKGFQRLYQKIPNSVGTLGVSPTANLTYTQAVAALENLSGSADDLTAIVSADQMAVIADAQKATFNNAVNTTFRTGRLPKATDVLGIAEWYSSSNVAYHTSGSAGTANTPLVNVAGGVLTGASSVVTDGWDASATLKAGDVFTFAGIYEVNSSNYASTGRLRQFTVTADTAAGTAQTINFTPSIVYAAGGQYNNVTGLPADNVAINLWAMAAGGTLTATASRQGLIFAPGSIIFAMADAPEVDAPVCVFARDDEAGISLRLTKGYEIGADNNLARVDAFWGWSVMRPEWSAIRVQGA